MSLFEADLLVPGSFEALMKGCYHVASPFFIENTIRDGQKEVVEPALKGTQHVLDAVQICETVKAVVLTSSVAAIFGDNADVMEMKQKTLSAEYFNTTSSVKYNTYPYSKTVAEKEAWKLVTINPGLVLGSSGRGKSHSFVEVACILRSITHSSRIPMHRLFNFLVGMSGPVLGLSQK